MRVVIAGGHGKIALLLARSLTTAGDEVVALIRNPDHAADVRPQAPIRSRSTWRTRAPTIWSPS